MTLHSSVAHNTEDLRRLRVTHALNAAHFAQGRKGDQTVRGQEMHYYRIPAEILVDFHLGGHFCTTSEYIHKAKCVVSLLVVSCCSYTALSLSDHKLL